MDGSPLRDGFDLPIAVDVGFLGLNKPYRGRNPTSKANADASPDSNPYPPLSTAAQKNFPHPIRWGR
ncbi:hypothetical protein PPM_1118 [Paenibacillus polymyxa M1]|nr:hypothetical protein PPM_1118 [Paenibacillus polymyxa M1]